MLRGFWAEFDPSMAPLGTDWMHGSARGVGYPSDSSRPPTASGRITARRTKDYDYAVDFTVTTDTTVTSGTVAGCTGSRPGHLTQTSGRGRGRTGSTRAGECPGRRRHHDTDRRHATGRYQRESGRGSAPCSPEVSCYGSPARDWAVRRRPIRAGDVYTTFIQEMTLFFQAGPLFSKQDHFFPMQIAMTTFQVFQAINGTCSTPKRCFRTDGRSGPKIIVYQSSATSGRVRMGLQNK